MEYYLNMAHPLSLEEDTWWEEAFWFMWYSLEESRLIISRIPERTSILTGSMYVEERLYGHDRTFYQLFRMEKATFVSLCSELQRQQFLDDSRGVRAEEALMMFLLIVGYKQGMRLIADRFQHSLETVCRHFKRVMRGLCRLGQQIIKPREGTETHPYVRNNRKYYPWFKDCIGAIDGTQVKAWSRQNAATVFRNRKSVIAQNVLAVCDFDMCFTFVYSGWEGSAHDSRVFYDAVTRPENKFPHPAAGQFYLVDAGFPIVEGYLPPYKGERYHIQQYRGNAGPPQGKRELFNYLHSSLRNVIERCFGVLKQRFPLLSEMPRYAMVRQPCIVTACCTVHNWIRMDTGPDEMFRAYSQPDMVVEGAREFEHDISGFIFTAEAAQAMVLKRDHMADLMWDSRQ